MNARRSAIAFWALVGAIALFYGVMASLEPIQGDDWLARYWIARQGNGVGSLLRWAVHHRLVGDLVSWILVAAPIANIVFAPALIVAFLIGLVALARGRVPRPGDPSAWLQLLIASTLVWVGAPKTGLDFFYRFNLAFFVAGLTAVLWLLFLFLYVEVKPGPARIAGVLLLAIAAGAGNHYVTPLAIYGVWKVIRRRRAAGPVPPWMWAGLAGIVGGAIILYTSKPYLPLKAVGHGGFEHNVFRLYLFMGQCGELVSLVMVTFFGLALRARLRPPGGPWPGPREIGIAGWAYGAALMAAILAVFAPRWGESAMFAPVAAMVVASLALIEPTLVIRGMRRAAIGVGAVLHLLIVLYSIPRYLEAHDAFLARVAILEATPPGGTARIEPYRKTVQDSWFLGDDMSRATTRGLVAQTYGLRAVEFTTTFGALEQSAGYTFDEVWRDEAGKVERTRMLTDDLEVARNIFGEDARERWRDGWRGKAELQIVGGLEWPARKGRPLIAERFDGDFTTPEYDTIPLDKRQRFSLSLKPGSLDGFYPFRYVVASNQDIPFDWDDDDHWILAQRSDRYALLACNYEECWVVMSLWYQL